jgi:predicted nucleic acid-binding Zn ribbon protein
MPLYKFKCTNDKCNETKEHMLSFNAFEDYKQKKLLIRCTKCNTVCEVALTTPSIKVQGGFYDRYSK